jgi:hypothetical protein
MGGSQECAPCPPNRYGATFGLNTSSCTSICVANPGTACFAESTAPSGTLCPAGKYSFGGVGLTNCLNCSSPAGYACPPGSMNATGTRCSAGTFGTGGAAPCTPCPAGTWGGSFALGAPECSGLCPAGYRCPPGSTNATSFPCPLGQYSGGGVGNCSLCPAGRFGLTGGAVLCPKCPAGTACPLPGTLNGTWSGCLQGQFAPQGAVRCTLCPRGRYGAAPGSAYCAGACAGGYVCPAGSTNATAGSCPPGAVSVEGGATCVQQNVSPPQYVESEVTNTLSGSRVLVVMDANMDGRPDFFVPNATDFTLVFFENTGKEATLVSRGDQTATAVLSQSAQTEEELVGSVAVSTPSFLAHTFPLSLGLMGRVMALASGDVSFVWCTFSVHSLHCGGGGGGGEGQSLG